MSTSAAYTGALRVSAYALTFALTLFIRVRGITTHFWMLWDQIRDWGIALGPFTRAAARRTADPSCSGTRLGRRSTGSSGAFASPSVRGSTIFRTPAGSARRFCSRRPMHCCSRRVWKRTGSLPIALLTVALLATSAYDLALAPIIWNPSIGPVLAKAATAMILLDWHRESSGSGGGSHSRRLERRPLLYWRRVRRAGRLRRDADAAAHRAQVARGLAAGSRDCRGCGAASGAVGRSSAVES